MEDNYQKGSRNKNKQVVFEEEADDESEEEAPAFVCIGPPSLQKIREVLYVDVPSLTPVVRTDRPRPKETEGPTYTTHVPIEKEEFGQEVLEEVLNTSLDVLKYRKVTRPGIEPRTFWTYTRCSNQLSYLA